MHSHLTSSRSCSWYAKGKLRDLGLDDDEDIFSFPASPLAEAEAEAESGLDDLGKGPEEDDGLGNYDPEQDSNLDDMDFGPYEYEMDFLYPNFESPDIGVAGPGPQTAANQILQGAERMRHPVLDDEDDSRVIEVDEDAGRIYRHDEPPRHFQVDEDGDSLMDNEGEPNPFFPFASELDWRVAQWAVKDGPGHNAFNRLLAIPGVSKF